MMRSSRLIRTLDFDRGMTLSFEVLAPEHEVMKKYGFVLQRKQNSLLLVQNFSNLNSRDNLFPEFLHIWLKVSFASALFASQPQPGMGWRFTESSRDDVSGAIEDIEPEPFTMGSKDRSLWNVVLRPTSILKNIRLLIPRPRVGLEVEIDGISNSDTNILSKIKVVLNDADEQRTELHNLSGPTPVFGVDSFTMPRKAGLAKIIAYRVLNHEECEDQIPLFERVVSLENSTIVGKERLTIRLRLSDDERQSLEQNGEESWL